MELDGLRGLAILLVVLCHYITAVPHGRSHSLGSMAGTAMGLGASGVGLFFILSGFLIGGILIDSKQSANYFRTFYLRRICRIFPLYYLWIALFAVLATTITGWQLHVPYWAYLTFVQNYFMQRTDIEAIWFGALWSLGVEEQFYLLAPPLIRKRKPQGLWNILIGILVLSFVLRLVLLTQLREASPYYWGLDAATYWTPSRAGDLAVGILAAVAWRTESMKQWIGAHLAYFKYTVAICAAALVATLPWLVRPTYFFSAAFGIPIFSILYLSMLIIALMDKQSVIATACRGRALRELGKISYCVYIIHVAVNWAVHKYVLGELPRFDSWRSIGVTALAVVVTLMIAEMSWFLYERPLIRRGHKYSY